MMEAQTWMNAYKAKELGFIDEILYTETQTPKAFDFSKKEVTNCIQNSLKQIQAKMQDNIEVEKLKLELELLEMG